MTRDNFFHLGNSSRQGCSFSGTFPFVGLVEMFRMANEKSSLSFVIIYSLMRSFVSGSKSPLVFSAFLFPLGRQCGDDLLPGWFLSECLGVLSEVNSPC